MSAKAGVFQPRNMERALETAGGDVHYRELADVGHDCWDPAFTDLALPRWLFAQHR